MLSPRLWVVMLSPSPLRPRGCMAAFPDLEVIMDNIVVDGDQTAGHSWVRTPVQAGPGNAFTSAVLKSGGWEQTDLLASQAGISTVQNTCVNSNRASTSLRRQPSVNCTGSKLLLTPVEKLFSECFDERSSLVSY